MARRPKFPANVDDTGGTEASEGRCFCSARTRSKTIYTELLTSCLIGSIGERHGLSASFAVRGIAFALAAASALLVPETQGIELTLCV